MFLDDDDLLFPDHVTTLARELRHRDDLAAVYSLALEVPTKLASLQPLEYRELSRQLVLKQSFSRALLQTKNYLPIQSVLFRRECYDQFGGFNEELECLEDWDLWLRYSSQRDFKLVDQVTSLYRVPGDARTAFARHKRFMQFRKSVEQSIANARGKHLAIDGAHQIRSPYVQRIGKRAKQTIVGNPVVFHIAWHLRHWYYRVTS